MSSQPSPIVVLRRRHLVVALFSLAACDSDSAPIVQESGVAGVGSSGENTKLGPNDRIRVIVFAQPTLTGEYTLDGNGVLAFPLVGNIPASGSTTSELQRAIAAKLSPDYVLDPKVSVEVTSRRPFYVIGEVHKPGNYPYVSDMTAINAVAMAGGFTYRARKNDFYIRRLDKDGRMVRIAAKAETVLRAGDTLEVRERMF